MKILKNCALILAVAFASLCIFNTQTFAAGRQVKKVYQYKHGKVTEISMDKYKQLKENSKYRDIEKKKQDVAKGKGHKPKKKLTGRSLPTFSSLVEDKIMASTVFNMAFIPPLREPIFEYEESGNDPDHYKWSDTRRVCSPVRNKTTNRAELTYAIATTQTIKSNTSLDSTYRSAIKSSIGSNYETSVSTNTTMKFFTDPGQYGWVEFTPETYNTWGYMNEYRANDYGEYEFYDWKFADIYSPKKELDSENEGYVKYRAAGLYELVASSNLP
jgi:hypothetical protein